MSLPQMMPWHLALVGAVLGSVVGPSLPAAAGSLGVLVPAFFYPSSAGDGASDGWAALTAAAASIPVTAIFDPATGPRPGPADPNYIVALTKLELGGGRAVAYVDTAYGAAPLAVVEGQIQTYLSQYGRLVAGPIPNLISGFFFDRMSNKPDQISYYQAIFAYVKGLDAAYEVIGNPGTATELSYVTASPATANTFLTFEGNAAGFTSANTESTRVTRYANTIYDQRTVAGMEGNVRSAAEQNVAYVYVTDQPLHPSTGYLYDRLPSYWDLEVATILAASAGR